MTHLGNVPGVRSWVSRQPRSPSPSFSQPPAQPVPRAGSRTTGPCSCPCSDGRSVSGTFTPKSFKLNKAGALVSRGTVDMVIRGVGKTVRTSTVATAPVKKINGTSATPTAAKSASSPAAAPAAALAPGACDILSLVLGPLDLDLLGLQVHLDKVVLNIIAQSGAGNLLGNLLCAVAGLLDGTPLTGLLGQLAALLNSILAILQA